MIINGEKKELPIMNVSELLISYELNALHVVVEVDEVIIEKESYDNTVLDKSSKIEIIAFVGGG